MSGAPLSVSPSIEVVYEGAKLSTPSILAYSRYAIVTVTSTKTVELFGYVLPRSLALTPSHTVITQTGLAFTSSSSGNVNGVFAYSLNITSLAPRSDYVLYITGNEPFGPFISTSITDTRTSFTTVNDGEKPSEGKQCPRGWSLRDRMIEFTQCSGNGVCIDSECSCYDRYGGSSCSRLVNAGVDVKTGNDTHHFVHTQVILEGDWDLLNVKMNEVNADVETENEVSEMVTFLKNSLQQLMAEMLMIDVSQVQIREWEMVGVNTKNDEEKGQSMQQYHSNGRL